mgnify:CR=1 FL=1
MTDQEKIEELLENYRSLKSDIRTTIIEKCPDYSIPAIDYSKVSGGETNAIYSSVESKVTERLDDKLKLMKKIKCRDIIYTAYMSLEIRKKQVIKYVYFEGLKQIQAGFRLEKSENTIGKWKQEALEDLKNNGVLRAWKYWEQVNCG